MAETKSVTPAERARLFGLATRQNLQMLPAQSANAAMQTLQWELPKSRLLAKIFLQVSYELTIKHASKTNITEEVKDPNLYPYALFSHVSLNLNNGFHPFTVGGKELAMLNMLREKTTVMQPVTDGSRKYCNAPLKASSTGTKNTIEVTFELQNTLNDRDAIGLILLQNAQTYATLEVTLADPATILKNSTGYTLTIGNVKVEPMLETFSIPATNVNAMPDLSVLKLVNSRSETIMGGGQNIVKMETGNIYRKLLMYLTDTDGNPLDDSAIDSNIELVFNQADTNYAVNPSMLRRLNEIQFGHPLPKGLFAFDFSYQGIANMGGSRDYIDTEKLTEFWLRFSSTEAGKVTLITEKISRLAASV